MLTMYTLFKVATIDDLTRRGPAQPKQSSQNGSRILPVLPSKIFKEL